MIMDRSGRLSAEYVAEKAYHVICEDGARRAYCAFSGMRLEGELWYILDGEFRLVMELRGSSQEAAIERAFQMIDGGALTTISHLPDDAARQQRSSAGEGECDRVRAIVRGALAKPDASCPYPRNTREGRGLATAWEEARRIAQEIIG